MSKLSLIHSTQQAGPNTEIYGPRSEYGFLRTARRPIRMQDSSKPYNKYILLNGLTYNPADYFTSLERIFPSPERARMTCNKELFLRFLSICMYVAL